MQRIEITAEPLPRQQQQQLQEDTDGHCAVDEKSDSTSRSITCILSTTCKDYYYYYTKRRIRLPQQRNRLPALTTTATTARLIFGSLLSTTFVFFCLFGVIYQWKSPYHLFTSSYSKFHPFHRNHIRGQNRPLFQPPDIVSYLDLFFPNKQNDAVSTDAIQNNDDDNIDKRRRLALELGNTRYPQLVIAGKMSVEDAPCNIAQYDMKTNQWSLEERIQLSLYNSYSGGEVYSLLANHTEDSSLEQGDLSINSKR